jgi:hypothetical protein
LSPWKAALAAAGLAIAGCGGSSGGLPEYRPQDYPPVKTTLLNAPFELAPGAAAAFDLDVPETGDLFATVDWTSPANNVVAAFSSPSCASVNLALAGSCPQGVYTTSPSLCPAKPRIVTANVTSGGRVRLYVANAGASFESGRVQITLCRDAPGCGAAAACAQCLVEKSRIESCR